VRPPFSYYGGKQVIANWIIENLPAHELYCEPFCGGAAVFWAKPPSKLEVLNDTNGEIVNFFRVCQDRALFEELQHRLQWTPYARDEHRKACKEPHNEPVDRAWAWMVNVNMGYFNKIGSGFGGAKRIEHRNHAETWYKRIDELLIFSDAIRERLHNTSIQNIDALACIEKYDSPGNLFYCDPPYINTDQGHYKGYTEADHIRLLDCLTSIKSSFVLSGYPNDLTPTDWPCITRATTATSAAGRHGKGKGARTECLWIMDRSTQSKHPELFDGVMMRRTA